jgi:hypothetical protein
MDVDIAEIWAAAFATLVVALASSRVAIFLLGRAGWVEAAKRFSGLFDRFTLFLRP